MHSSGPKVPEKSRTTFGGCSLRRQDATTSPQEATLAPSRPPVATREPGRLPIGTMAARRGLGTHLEQRSCAVPGSATRRRQAAAT
jgi:hypothetical protein